MINFDNSSVAQLMNSNINTATQSSTKQDNNMESSGLEKTVKENLKKSVKYQIIDKLMIKKNDDDKMPEQKQDAVKLSTQGQEKLKQESVNAQSVNLSAQQASIQQNNAGQAAVQQTQTQTSRRLTISRENTPVEQPNKSDPIIFDLNGNGIETSGVQQGQNFDINADGKMDQTSFVTGGDAFLAYDKNGNGVIDNGSELFGDQNGAQNGYEELAQYDDNQDGQINQQDKIYDKLKLLSVNAQGQQQLSSLADQQISSINLNYKEQNQQLSNGDELAQTASFTRSDGTTGNTADALLAYKSY